MKPRGARWQTIRRVPGFERFFAVYVRRLLARSFGTVWIRRESSRLPSGGYVAVANHSSWWDGFVPFALHTANVAGPFAILMSDAELQRFPFFRWGGAFSIDPASPRSARSAIVYAAAQVRAGAGLWIFPEGILQTGSMLPFSSGFVHAARAAAAPVVPVALRFALLGRQRPEAFVDVGVPLDASARDVRDRAESAVRDRLARIDREIVEGSLSERYLPLVRGVRGIDECVATFIREVRR